MLPADVKQSIKTLYNRGSQLQCSQEVFVKLFFVITVFPIRWWSLFLIELEGLWPLCIWSDVSPGCNECSMPHKSCKLSSYKNNLVGRWIQAPKSLLRYIVWYYEYTWVAFLWVNTRRLRLPFPFSSRAGFRLTFVSCRCLAKHNIGDSVRFLFWVLSAEDNQRWNGHVLRFISREGKKRNDWQVDNKVDQRCLIPVFIVSYSCIHCIICTNTFVLECINKRLLRNI